MARVFRDRLDLLESDIALMSGNEETQRLLALIAAGDTAAAREQVRAHDRYIADLWRVVQSGYGAVTLRDSSGAIVSELGDASHRYDVTASGLDRSPSGDGMIGSGSVWRIVRPVVDLNGAHLGELEVQPLPGELLRGVGLDERFGERGRNLLVERSSHRLVAGSGANGETMPYPFPASAEELLVRPRGSFRYEKDGERRVASFVSFGTPPWALVATASADEFADPFRRQRLVDLLLLFVVIATVSVGFFLVLRRTTRSLDQLAAAAVSVGRGELSPGLPPDAHDEVGHLAAAFRVMTGRIREMIAQVEAGRQTAVLGRFAVELAHEIRNPLTSVKLNLQGLERDARDGLIPEESRAAVAMALREIRRLDQALHTALMVGRPAAEARVFEVGVVLREAAILIRAEAAVRGVAIECATDTGCDHGKGDPEALRGVFVNLFLNAVQAMERSGTVRASTHAIRPDREPAFTEIRIRDEGAGIPPELRERIFHPFFTTKQGGTGLGLSVALQTVRAMGGSLRISDLDGERGAEVVVILPLETAETAT